MSSAKIKQKSKRGGARPGSGRPRTIPDAEREAIERARSKGRAHFPDLVDIMIEGTRATKVEFVKDEAGWVPVGDAPDWPNRTRCAEWIADRCGLPKHTHTAVEMTDSEKAAAWLAIADE